MLVFTKMNEAAGTQKIWPLLLLLLLGAGLIIESNGPACVLLCTLWMDHVPVLVFLNHCRRC
jgi:hypothetical protein